MKRSVQRLKKAAPVHKRAEDVFAEHDRLIRTLVAQSAGGITLLDQAGNVVYDATTLETRLGFTADELQGRDILALVHPEDRGSTEAFLRRVLRSSGKPVPMDVRVIAKDGSVRILHVTGTNLMRDPDVRGILINSFDITDRKNAEEALRKAKAELEQKVRERTARLRALAVQLNQAEEQEQRRIAKILHDDLQQIVAGSRYFLGQLKDESLSSRERRDVLKRVEGSLEKAQQLMRSLCMDLHPPILHELGLCAGLKWLQVDVKQRLDLDMELDADDEAEPASASVRSFLFQAVRELLFNVVKHARVRKAQVELRPVDAGTLLLQVQDRGVGFDPGQIQPASFGLFSIRERVDFLGGQVKIQSAAGKGTRIGITMPRI